MFLYDTQIFCQTNGKYLKGLDVNRQQIRQAGPKMEIMCLILCRGCCVLSLVGSLYIEAIISFEELYKNAAQGQLLISPQENRKQEHHRGAHSVWVGKNALEYKFSCFFAWWSFLSVCYSTFCSQVCVLGGK